MVEPVRLGVKTEEEMLADGPRLAPIIARAAAFFMAVSDRDVEDYPWELVRGYAALLPCEKDFVRAAASDLHENEDIEADAWYHANKWFKGCREDAA